MVKQLIFATMGFFVSLILAISVTIIINAELAYFLILFIPMLISSSLINNLKKRSSTSRSVFVYAFRYSVILAIIWNAAIMAAFGLIDPNDIIGDVLLIIETTTVLLVAILFSTLLSHWINPRTETMAGFDARKEVWGLLKDILSAVLVALGISALTLLLLP